MYIYIYIYTYTYTMCLHTYIDTHKVYAHVFEVPCTMYTNAWRDSCSCIP